MQKQSNISDFFAKSAEKLFKKRDYSEISAERGSETKNKSQKKKIQQKKQNKEQDQEQIQEEKEQDKDQMNNKNEQQNVLESYQTFVNSMGKWSDTMDFYVQKGQKFEQLYNFLKQEYSSQTIYPPQELIFNAFNHVPFDNIKVVVVGQDPYIKDQEAMGLSFSVPKHIKCPPSLKNIYGALQNDKEVDFKYPKPEHGDLTNWAKQGVFLLNAVLTVRKGLSNSHQKKGWELFTDEVINQIARKRKGVVFMLWGLKAQEKAKVVNTLHHCVLKYTHPSPLAGKSFKECKHFSEANKYLISQGIDPIDWNL